MPKGQFPKLTFISIPICNIPIDTSDITKVLPQGADSSGLKTQVKLSRSRLIQSYFNRICLFGSFLLKGKKTHIIKILL